MRSEDLNRREWLALAGGAAMGAPRRAGMREIAASQRFTVDADPDIYMHSAGIAWFGKELVCVYRRSDEHTASEVEIWCARSYDRGRTWKEHKRISRLAWEPDRACWVAPQTSKLRDGRLVVLCDRGEKKTKTDWPMLSQWQMKDRGMSNWLFESRDAGRTWEGPRKVDDVGGEPSYIVELSSGTWMYTRTDSRPTSAVKVPAKPWGANYYRSTAVFSDDNGKTWMRTVPLADDPLVGDCEVGVAEYAPGRLIAITRIGDGGSAYGQPSRFVFSSDYGRTWSKPVLSPIYAHRPCVGKLRSGKLLVTYRNAWGTTGTYAFVFDPAEQYGYQPNSFIWDESRCVVKDGVMEIRTADGTPNAVQFNLYPVEDDDSAVELETELLVKEADEYGCLIAAGGWLRFTPGRVSLKDRPEEGFGIRAGEWHKYRVASRDKRMRVWADGQLKLDVTNEGVFQRHVRFGNLAGAAAPSTALSKDPTRPKPLGGVQYHQNGSHTLWRSMSVKVINRRDHSIDWIWSAKDGYPDQFRRDRIVRVERNGSFSAGNCGYSGWHQAEDGTIAIADFTTGDPPAPRPVLRAYVVGEGELG